MTANGVTPLDPLDYWRLRALTADLDAAQARLEALRTRRQALWAALAEKYHLEAAGAYAARDEDCALLATPPP
ncbi:MAG TPA: hypothetical protein VKE26_26290 [Xanthobacteraceae bacterium]|nr:hypothetical protein [Xanthobacteraceae bacterium]